MNKERRAKGRGRRRTLVLSSVAIVLLSLASSRGERGEGFQPEGTAVINSDRTLDVTLISLGPPESVVAAQKAQVLTNRNVSRLLSRTKFRLLSMEMLDDDDLVLRGARYRYRATIYDYSHNRTVLVTGEFGVPEPDSIKIGYSQPLPNYEEFKQAIDFVRQDPLLGPSIVRGELVPYRPMPPIVRTPGSLTRILAVGLRPRAVSAARHEIIGVEMSLGKVIRFARGAPPHSAATEDLCGPEDSGMGTGSRDELRNVLVTIARYGQVVWRFVVVRPSSSSGINGSGVELRHVEYLGKRVLERAHMPILNVKYEGDTCGPYRDWLWEEGFFDATGNETSPGFIECDRSPATIAETGSDQGNYRGVAVYVVGGTARIVSELNAGWYRYTSEWRFDGDGTIHPRFHFSAVGNSCTCLLHTHHAYWRFDFSGGRDERETVHVRDSSNVDSPWRQVHTEQRFLRDPQGALQWRIESESGWQYTIKPGFADGTADDFGAGDVWALRYQPGEIDDGVGFTETEEARADLDSFVNGEPLDGQGIVVWYAAHVRHGSQDLPSYDIGPDLSFSNVGL